MSPRVFSHEPINFKSMPPAIRALIIANLIGFVLSRVVPDCDLLFGLVPELVLTKHYVWQPVTYLFIHGPFMHLLFNLFALWMFGMPVESQWGGAEFLKYYFLCGLGAAGVSIAMAPHSGVPIIGASGPIYGLLVAFAMLYPDSVVYLYFLLPVKAAHMAVLFGLIEFFSSTPGIARYAHLGGMATGYLYIRWWWVVKMKAKALWQEGVAVAPSAPRSRQTRRAVKAGAEADADDDPMAEVDRILDKILVSGLDSLTEEEREIMRRYSDRMKH